MRSPSRESIQRSAAVGAVAVCGALVAFFAFFVFLTFPKGNGIDTTEATVAWIAVGMLILAVILSHLVYARVLYRASRKGHSA